ncbi:hypothetical protein ACTXKL_13120 [Brachybacterium tyrofermentans]|uniref:hypothetical protein n=1 Tax=Brachybacterium tyrofermentans TaxID=47848 RepID=UPI003FB788DA
MAVTFSEAAFDGVDVAEARFDVVGFAGSFFPEVGFEAEDFGAEDVEADDFAPEAFTVEDFAVEGFVVDDFVVDDVEEDVPAAPVERVRLGFAVVGASAVSVELSADVAAPREVVDRVDAPRPRR